MDVSKPLPGAAFGATVRPAKSIAEELPDDLPAVLADAGGLLLIPGLGEITARPELLLELSRLFGPEVEDYRFTLANPATVHVTVPEIFIVSNMPPVGKAPTWVSSSASLMRWKSSPRRSQSWRKLSI